MARQWMTHDCFCNMETHVAGQVGQKKIQFQCSEGEFIRIEFCQEQIRKWLELVLFTGTLDLLRCTELMPYVKKTFAHVSR